MRSKPDMNLPMECVAADSTQRFGEGAWVSHNGGLIERDSKRRIAEVVGYDPDGGMRYRLVLPDGADRGFAYDDELDLWPGDDAPLPVNSPRHGQGMAERG